MEAAAVELREEFFKKGRNNKETLPNWAFECLPLHAPNPGEARSKEVLRTPAIERVLNDVRQGAPKQGYRARLLRGVAGLGKTTLARILAVDGIRAVYTVVCIGGGCGAQAR